MRIGETTQSPGSEYSVVRIEIERGDRPDEFMVWFHSWAAIKDKFRIEFYFGGYSSTAVIHSRGDLQVFMDGWRLRDAFDRC